MSHSENSVRLHTQNTSEGRETLNKWVETSFLGQVSGGSFCADLVLDYHHVGPQCSFAHRMQHTEDRESTGNIDSIDVILIR